MTKKRNKRFWIIRFVLVVAVMLGVYLLFFRVPSGPVQITISKETTHISGPVNEDGTVNYVAYLNAKHSKGVTKENNAAIPLIEIIGLDLLPRKDIVEVCRILKIEPPSGSGKRFISLKNYIKKIRNEGHWEIQEDEDELDKTTTKTTSTSWKAQDHPLIAGWLKANDDALNTTHVAMERSGYYMPAAASNPEYGMISICIPRVSLYAKLGSALTARAMLKLDSGDLTGACADLTVTRHLARRIGRGHTLLDRLVAIAIETIACRGYRAMAGSGKLTAAQARALLADMRQLSPLPNIVDTIDESERFFTLDCVMILARTSRKLGVEKALDKLMDGGEVSESSFVLSPRSLQWDRILLKMNPWYDSLVAASRHKTFKARTEALADHDRRVKLFKDGVLRRPRSFLRSISGHFRDPSDEIGDILISIILPATSRIVIIHDHGTAEGNLVVVTMALAAYKAEKKAYPDKLSQLSPGYLKKVPDDIFIDKPFFYKRTDKGYLLHSVGENMKYDGTDKEDDIVVEVK